MQNLISTLATQRKPDDSELLSRYRYSNDESNNIDRLVFYVKKSRKDNDAKGGDSGETKGK